MEEPDNCPVWSSFLC